MSRLRSGSQFNAALHTANTIARKNKPMTINPVAEGHYRIRIAGAKSDIANAISNGKKCHYVQIGGELFDFESLEAAKKFVGGKGLVADLQSLDFGTDPPEADEETVAEREDDNPV